jgi:thioredoxin reductase (NADPH)
MVVSDRDVGRRRFGVMDVSLSSWLSDEQLQTLRAHGEERTAEVGDVLYRVGDRTYPFIAIVEGEAAILDANGNEIVRHAAHGFLGELNLLSGQTVYVTAVVTQRMRYIAVDREEFRRLLFDDEELSDAVTSAFVRRRDALQQRDGLGVEIIGPHSSQATRAIVEYVRRNRIAHVWRDTDEPATAALADGLRSDQLPVVVLPGGLRLEAPSWGDVSRALGIGAELAPREEVDLLVVGAGPGGIGAAVYGASEGLDTLVIESTALGGQAGTSRRIENYLGFPAGISGSELTSRAVVQARKFGARFASPYRAVALEPAARDGERHVVRLEDGGEVAARAVVLATGAEYRRLDLPNRADFEGTSVFYAAGPPEARQCAATRVGVVGGGNSAAQAAIWLVRGGALVTLLHRRADLRETMSDYLIHDLARYGVEVRDRSEIGELHGAHGRLDGVTLKDGALLPVKFLFMFLGAVPCTDWLADTIARDANGFVLTGDAAGQRSILDTSVPGVFAVGDARSGSVKRCATAVGEGAMVVRFVHERMSGVPA